MMGVEGAPPLKITSDNDKGWSRHDYLGKE